MTGPRNSWQKASHTITAAWFSSSMLRVCYISMLCEDGTREHAVTAASAEGVDDGCWLAARLAESGQNPGSIDLTRLSIALGDKLPCLADEATGAPLFDMIVLGGTFFGVHDGRPWQQPLRAWLLAQRASGTPLLGICGGHQAMAVAAGGRVTRRPGGTAAGSLPVTTTAAGAVHPLLAGIAQPAFHFGNGDEVSTVPPEATVLATTDDSPAVALDYGGGWLSTQFHPEASHTMFQHWVDAGIIGAPAPEIAYRELGTGRALIANFLAWAASQSTAS